MVPMQVSHIILGRPQQYDRRVSFDGYSNTYSFVYRDKKITLVLLTPKQVQEDQKNLLHEFDLDKKISK